MGRMSKHRGGGVSRHGERFRARLRVDGATISLGVYDSREEAELAVDVARKKVDGGVTIPGAHTLRDWGAKWLDRRETGQRVAGIDRERSVWRTHIVTQPIADFPVGSITRVHVKRWVDYLTHDARALDAIRRKGGIELRTTDRRLSRQTIQHALRVLRGVLQSAVEAGLVERNVARDVKPPKASRDEGTGDGVSWTWLTVDEIDSVLSATKHPNSGRRLPPRHRLTWTIAIYTGLRRGELRDLQWRDVLLDNEHPLIRVRRSKSNKSREVPLLPPALDAVRRWRELEPGIGTARVWTPMRRKKDEPRGGQMHKDWDLGWRSWGPAIVGRHVRTHDLRHTTASHLVQGTWGRALSLYEVKEWLGHSSITVSQRYAHLAPDGLRGVAADMARAWPARESDAAGEES